MRYMEDKKGQGFDTFKLLIAAVVAMIILGIVTGVFSKIYAWIFRLECPSGGAISTIVTAIQDAKTGYDKTTDNMCMNEGEGFSNTAIEEKISGVTLDFSCPSGISLCSEGGGLTVSSTRIDAERQVRFRGRVTCTSGGGGQDAHCTMEILNPK